MDSELIELRARVSKLSNEELFLMLNTTSADYRVEALYYATEELTRRGIPFSSTGENVSYAEFEKYDQIAPKYYGVGGWLAFLCISLTILSPLRTLAGAAKYVEIAFTYLASLPGVLSRVVGILVFLYLGFIAIVLLCFSVIAGVCLWTVRSNAVAIAKGYLIALFAISILFGTLAVIASEPDGVAVFSNIPYAVIWYAYLTASRRVKATYAKDTRNLGSTSAE